ncbi:MAG: hypothetical protein CL677_02420, partial [Bdellovibrionaceae bacterium]|nr:hypothetical protein [Pseudobdellovibrionaceae bacterium]
TAWFFETEYWVALGLSSFILAGPIVAYVFAPRSIYSSIINAMSLMIFSGLLIHLGRGMIEMHFHIFVFLAAISRFGLVSPLISAAGVVVAHHLLAFFLLPTSLFNYDASFWVVLLHAAFVVVEMVPLTLIALTIKQNLNIQGSVVLELEKTVKESNETSNQLADGAVELSDVANNQASSVQESASAIEQIRGMLAQSGNRVKQATGSCNSLEDAAGKGQSNIQNMVSDIDSIAKASTELESIREMMSQIEQKTDVINQIVFKTQLLSFNASIEAARAGVHGRGFSVVAVEVGKLATLSGDASTVIGELLENSKRQVDSIVNSIEDKVEKGHTSSTMAKESFDLMAGELRKVSQHIVGIASANDEQEQGLNEVAKAMEQLSMATSTTGTRAEDVATLAKTIKSQSEGLNVHIARMKMDKKNKRKPSKSFNPLAALSENDTSSSTASVEIEAAPSVGSNVEEENLPSLSELADMLVGKFGGQLNKSGVDKSQPDEDDGLTTSKDNSNKSA